MSRHQASTLPRELDAALRELHTALGKATMYPAGHSLVRRAVTSLTDRLTEALERQPMILLGVTPRGLVLDGTAVEPLSPLLRELAARLHRKNVGTVHVLTGIREEEVAGLLEALAAGDADESIGREGLRLAHLRVEPLLYDVLALSQAGDEIDEVFWTRLVEAAFGRQLDDGEVAPSTNELAQAIEGTVGKTPDSSRRVYEALAAFATAIASRGERTATNARRRFAEVLSALSRPTTTVLLQAAPSGGARRRFLRDTLEQVPPALLLQLLEAVAGTDGAPISPQLRAMLGKLAGTEERLPSGQVGAFTAQVADLLAVWEGASGHHAPTDPRLLAEGLRVVGLALEVGSDSPHVLEVGRRVVAAGQLGEFLAMVDHPDNDPTLAQRLAAAALDPQMLERQLHVPQPDWALITRITNHAPAAAVGPLLDALGRFEERSQRRRLLDLLASVGPTAEAALLTRLPGAPWFLARNILWALGQLPRLTAPEGVHAMLAHDDARVRQEALKALVRHPETRVGAVTTALESGETLLTRTALAALHEDCPPQIVAPLLGLLAEADDELRLQAIRLLANVDNPLVIGPLLALVRRRSGLLRRWRLQPTTPVMLAALVVLAQRWPSHRPVVLLMQLARQSGDSRIQSALELMGGGRW
jgi:HEAT repeat protein